MKKKMFKWWSAYVNFLINKLVHRNSIQEHYNLLALSTCGRQFHTIKATLSKNKSVAETNFCWNCVYEQNITEYRHQNQPSNVVTRKLL